MTDIGRNAAAAAALAMRQSLRTAGDVAAAAVEGAVDATRRMRQAMARVALIHVYRAAYPLQRFAKRMRHRAKSGAGPTRVVLRSGLETIQTEDLLALHDRLFAPLDAKGKTRILTVVHARSRTRGWRAMNGLAA